MSKKDIKCIKKILDQFLRVSNIYSNNMYHIFKLVFIIHINFFSNAIKSFQKLKILKLYTF
jgi:hypothetical protein